MIDLVNSNQADLIQARAAGPRAAGQSSICIAVTSTCKLRQTRNKIAAAQSLRPPRHQQRAQNSRPLFIPQFL